jgi:integrase
MEAIELFLSSIRSPETRNGYNIYFKKYLDFIHTHDIFYGNNPRLIESKIIEFLIDMRNKGKGYSTIHNYISAILAFYKINDIILNTGKINKFVPENHKVRKDRAFTHEEISKLLAASDERMKAVILLLASSGIRLGALSTLRMKHLQYRKLLVYENDREEYFTFITPECNKALDSYFDMRSRYGEKINNGSYLIREQFDVRDPFQAKKPRQVNTDTIRWKLIDLERRVGVRSKDVKAAHGFRKFFTTQVINSKVNPEIREMLLGHKIALASCYYRPTEDEMYSEYEKAINNLTINEENRLKRKMEKIESEKSRIELLELKHQMDLEKVKLDYNKVISLIQQNPKLAHAKPESLVGKGKN